MTGFLSEATGSMQWGFRPNLWPEGSIQRLNNWGWQIQNPNVVLRAIDPSPSPGIMGENEKEGESESDDEDEKDDNQLWQDLLTTLENVPLRNAPRVNEFPITVDLPRAFIEEYD